MKIIPAILILPLLCSAAIGAVNVQVNPDGTRYSAVLLNGATSGKYDIAFVGDGFTSSAADQAAFNNAVNAAVQAMRNESPYGENICAFNVWRVNVLSAQSGIDEPLAGITRNTELNCTFGNDVSAPARVIYSTTPNRVTEAADFAPAHDAIYVLVNSATYGGAAGSIVYTSLNSSMGEVIIHELGHFVGGLADEYNCYFCDGRTEPAYTGPEPTQVNVTKQTTRSLIKWNSFIAASTPLPTSVNTPPGVVGLWEGALYSGTGVYRPQQDCLMRALYLDHCRVCSAELSRILRPYCTACERDPNSIFCYISKMRHRFWIYEYPRKLKIPPCLSCPFFDLRRSEIELTINPRQYDVKVVTGDDQQIQADIQAIANGSVRISFDARPNTDYSLLITPIGQISKGTEVRAKMKHGGKEAFLF